MPAEPKIEHYVAPYILNAGDKPPCICKTMQFTSINGEWSVDIDDLDFSLPLNCKYSRFLRHLKYLMDWPDKNSDVWHDDGEIKTCDIFIPQSRHRGGVNKVATDYDDPFSKHLTRRVVHLDPCSDNVWRLIHSWIKNCQTSHTKCRGELSVWPSRLLKIGMDGDVIQLVEDSKKLDLYIALSHCWGKTKTIMTTRENLKAHKIGIRVSELPQTLQDAIIVAKKLGVRYLWIDSLCIIQGDLKDWETEGSKMDQVYNNAYVTIAATRASGDGQGFLQHRLPRAILTPGKDGVYYERQEESKFHRVFIKSSGQPLGSMYFSSYNDWVAASELSGDSNRDRWNSPLLFRAWTLQERYLARRTLSFLKDQIMFECEVERCYEGGQTALEAMTDNSVESLLPTPLPNAGCSSYSSGRLPSQRSFDSWYEMISAYTMRDLTYPIDKLPALSGLASRLGKRTGSAYYAGIWEQDLFTGLLWYAPFGAQCERYSWRSPSWSWASIEGAVKFPSEEIEYPGRTVSMGYPFDSAKMFGYAIGSTILPSVCVHSIEVEREGEERFGQVKGGVLDIEAVMMPIKGPKRSWMRNSLCESLETDFIFDESGPETEEDPNKLWEHHPEAYSSLPIRLALFIMETTLARVVKAKRAKNRYYDVLPSIYLQDNEEPMFCGIVIEKIPDAEPRREEVWKRIGAFKSMESYGKSTFDIEKQERRRFKII